MEPYRDRHRSCPRCQAQLREFRDRLVCDTCGGVMLSIEDLRGAVAELTGLPPTLTYRDEKPGTRPCPQCAAAMTTLKLTLEIEGVKPAKPKAELDRCEVHGLWFDDAELAIVLEPLAGKGFGGGMAGASVGGRQQRPSGPAPARSFNFKIGGRGWGL